MLLTGACGNRFELYGEGCKYEVDCVLECKCQCTNLIVGGVMDHSEWSSYYFPKVVYMMAGKAYKSINNDKL